MTGDAFSTYDAAYVLGALSPADRHAFERHLQQCPNCARSVRELAGMPGLLAKVPREDATALAAEAPEAEGQGPAEARYDPESPPETLLPALLARVSAMSRPERTPRRLGWLPRTRWLSLSAALAGAACLVAVVLAGVSGVIGGPSTGGATGPVAMHQVVSSPLRATAQLEQVAWGTRIDVRCWYDIPDAGGHTWGPYSLVVIDTDGHREQVASWNAVGGKTVTVDGATALSPDRIAKVEVRSPDGQPMLRLSF